MSSETLAPHLSPDIGGDISLVPTRNGFGEGIVEAGERDDRIVALCADLTDSLRLGQFKNQFADRFFDCGVAEQNMVSMAVGLALSGKIPYAGSFGVFVPNRAYDQIRISVCYNNVHVVLAASHTGVTVGEDGATHQALEDLALTRVLPNMTVLAPSDAIETKKATVAAAAVDGPVYIRFGRPKAPVFTTEESPFVIGRAEILRQGDDMAFIACGRLVYEALLAARELADNGVEAAVVNCHTIKPIDSDTIARVARDTGAVVTAEEHQIIGGLGSAVAEVLARERPTPVEFVGVHDRFGESGAAEEMLEAYGLKSHNLVDAAHAVLRRKTEIGAYA